VDIRDATAGKDNLWVSLILTSDALGTNSGWNIDAFEVRGRSCEPYFQHALPGEASNLRVSKGAPGQRTLEWSAGCGAATSYGIYRGDLLVGYDSIAPEPGACDVIGNSAARETGHIHSTFQTVQDESVNQRRTR
jgi:hypothetical protein